MALTCAAINDVTAWCLLAFVVSVMQATPGGAIHDDRARPALYIARDADGRAARSMTADRDAPRHARRISASSALALVLVAVLLSAVATEFIGIHAIFGAFLLGAIMPHDSRIAEHVTSASTTSCG